MLKGRRVILTAVSEHDRDVFFEWINTPELVRLGAPYQPVHPAAHAEWFGELASDPTKVAFAIRLIDESPAIGLVQLIKIHPIHRNAEMVIRIGDPVHQSKGYGTEALELILDHAWRDLNLHRVAAQVFTHNCRAAAAYTKAGFVEEGRLREAAYIDGEWRDIIVMGILAPERHSS